MAAAVMLAGVGVARAEGPNPIELRQTGMDLNGGSFAFIKAMVTTKGDPKTIEPVARGMARWAAIFPSLFPPGSDKGETKALPEIWSDPAGFKKDAAAFGTASTKLADDAKAGNADAMEADFKAVGQACGACHKAYRAK